MAPAFEGIYVPNVTPFVDGRLDRPGLERVLGHLIDNGVDGVVPTGTTGETATLTDEEKREGWAASVEFAAGRVPVIAGAGTNDTRHTIELTAMARDSGADAVLLITPYYNVPTQDGLYAHFAAVAASTELPILLYNIPGRTGVNLEPATTARLAAIDNIVGVKESSNLEQIMAVIASTEEFSVLCGEDQLILASACLGAHGAISASVHIHPASFVAMFWLVREGRLGEARTLQYLFQPTIKLLFSESSPSPLKAACEMLGLCTKEVRLPLLPATDELTAALRRELVHLSDELNRLGLRRTNRASTPSAVIA